ncbi:MAG: hypothetical protein FD177_457 [Desulfovibrionaceae bacterium]|nr:MAG: hypothetical protein FD177_457 [Desulfovibrionaceae bacterium]
MQVHPQMMAHNLLRSMQGPFPALDELRIGRAFLLLEVSADGQLHVAEVIVRQVRNLQQGVQVVVFIVYSTDGQVLTPGDTIERQVDLEAEQNWTLAQIHYY